MLKSLHTHRIWSWFLFRYYQSGYIESSFFLFHEGKGGRICNVNNDKLILTENKFLAKKIGRLAYSIINKHKYNKTEQRQVQINISKH